jgi:hypothetical protein
MAYDRSLGLDHPLSGSAGLRDSQLHRALLLAPLPALHAQGLERAHASFVAGAARLDALPDPDFLLGQAFVEQGIGLGLGMQAFLAPAQVVVVVARPTRHLATVDLHDSCRQRTQEAAIVGDKHEAATQAVEEVFQPGDGIEVEMVGGFVQQEHIGLFDQRLRQQHPTLHATGQRRELFVFSQAQALHHLGDTPVHVPALGRFDPRLHHRDLGQVLRIVQGMAQAVELGQVGTERPQARRHHVEHAATRAMRDFLRQARNAHPGCQHDRALVGLHLARQQLHQGRLAGTVAADDADTLAWLQAPLHVFEQQVRPADAVADIAQCNQGHGSGPGQGPALSHRPPERDPEARAAPVVGSLRHARTGR